MVRARFSASHLLRRLGSYRFLPNALLALVYFAIGKLGLLFAVVHPSTSSVWPAAGLALAALLLFGRRLWPGVFLGAFLVNLTTSGLFLASIAIAIGNTLEGVVARYLVDRYNAGRRYFDRAGDVGRFFALAGVLSPAIAATVGATSLVLGGVALPSDFGGIWVTWWLGDAVGVLVVAPLILLWAHDPVLRWTRAQASEAIALLFAIVVVSTALFGAWLPKPFEHYPLDFLAIPMLVWAAARFSPREVASAVVVLSCIAISGTVNGSGPFASTSPSDSLLLLEGFLGVTAVLALAFGVLMTENRLAHEVTARMATIVTSSNDPIIAMTLDGTITSWNPAAENLFGFTAEDAIGRDIRMVLPPDLRHEEDEVLAKIRRGERVEHFQTVRTRRDGTLFPVELTISPVNSSDGTIVGASKIVRDISDRARLESEKTDLLVREQRARAEAEAGNQAKDEFLAILSHELRTPLNAVYGWARMLQAARLDEETSVRALDAIVRNANAQVQMIDDLLDVSRVINGKMRLDVRPLDVKEVIEAALESVGPAAEAKGVRLEAVLDPRGATINGDPVRLQQVVWNLAMNAVKFTPSGGSVQVQLRRADGSVEIIVSDTGQGISEHVLPFVFDRFRQWDSSSTRAHSGLGLGLALVKHLTELHRGTVSATSAGEGRGATFKVTLPLGMALQRVTVAPARPLTIPQRDGVRLDRLKVLVVDDEPDALALTATILGNDGADVRTCRTPGEALAVLQDWRPDVLVSDIEMPGEDGYSLIKRVRALDEACGGGTPAVALSAYGRAEDRVRALSSGYNMHVPKPVDPEEFTTIVASVARVLRFHHRSA